MMKLFSVQLVSLPLASLHCIGAYEIWKMRTSPISLKDFRKFYQPLDYFSQGKTYEMAEREIWKKILNWTPASGKVEGASLFTNASDFSFNKISCYLRKGIDAPIPAITTPTLQIGAWKTANGWHKQYQNLAQISYLHYGQPRIWYSVVQSNEKEMYKYVSREMPDLFKKCPEYFQRRSILIEPRTLLK